MQVVRDVDWSHRRKRRDNMLKVLECIKKHKDWEAKLTEKPFCLKIKREGKFILLEYSQLIQI